MVHASRTSASLVPGFTREQATRTSDGCTSKASYPAGMSAADKKELRAKIAAKLDNHFFTLKRGGSEALDIITNGIEAPEERSGEMQGNLISRLLDGSMPSYQTLLASAAATDSLRVVDGELDNTYAPDRVKLHVTAR